MSRRTTNNNAREAAIMERAKNDPDVRKQLTELNENEPDLVQSFTRHVRQKYSEAKWNSFTKEQKGELVTKAIVANRIPMRRTGGKNKKRRTQKKKITQRYVPKRLTRKDRKKQIRELKKSRKQYKKGNYYTRKKVKSFTSKKSKHITKAEKMYKIRSLKPSRNLAKKTGCSLSSLNQIIKKGQGAYFSSGSRPNQTGHSWAYARLASSITGGKSAAVDFKILESGCGKNSKALKLAKKSRKRHGNGRRRVAKTHM